MQIVKIIFLVDDINQIHLIIPNSIHAEPRLLDIQVRNAAQELVFPPVHLDKAHLIVTHDEPLIAPRTRADSIAVTAAGRCRVETDLPLDGTSFAELEGRDVACKLGRVGPGSGEEVFA